MSLALHSRLLDAAGFQHGFFTRQGGVSKPPWDTLNFSFTTGDDPAAVRSNWERAARHLGVDADRIYVLRQVHGIAHCVVTGDEAPHTVMGQAGDIAMSQVGGVACGVRTADCPAVLLADRRSGAVAAIHSGWRGTVAGAAAAGMAALRQLVGDAGDIVAAIGPHIEQCCFEVGDDVAQQLAEASQLGERAIDRSHPKPHVDLRGIIAAQLAATGLSPAAIEHVRGCTLCEPQRFHSYRRNGKRGGRLLAAIVARQDATSAVH